MCLPSKKLIPQRWKEFPLRYFSLVRHELFSCLLSKSENRRIGVGGLMLSSNYCAPFLLHSLEITAWLSITVWLQSYPLHVMESFLATSVRELSIYRRHLAESGPRRVWPFISRRSWLPFSPNGRFEVAIIVRVGVAWSYIVQIPRKASL